MNLALSSSMPIAVASRSFSQTARLRAKLREHFPNCYFNESGEALSGERLATFLDQAVGAIIALETVNGALLDELPNLKVISKYGVGLDSIDQSALSVRGVRLLHSPGVNKYSVAELALGSAIGLMHRAPQSGHRIRLGEWGSERGRDLRGKVVGVVGCGHVGKEFARLTRLLGCSVLVHDIVVEPGYMQEFGLRAVSLSELLSASDVVSIHLPLDDTTRCLMGAKELNQMKRGAILLNYSRGGIVDEIALAKLLESGHLESAAIDVFAEEPNINSPLAKLPNVLATAHIGGSTEEAIDAMGNAAIDGLVSLLPHH